MSCFVSLSLFLLFSFLYSSIHIQNVFIHLSLSSNTCSEKMLYLSSFNEFNHGCLKWIYKRRGNLFCVWFQTLLKKLPLPTHLFTLRLLLLFKEGRIDIHTLTSGWLIETKSWSIITITSHTTTHHHFIIHSYIWRDRWSGKIGHAWIKCKIHWCITQSRDIGSVIDNISCRFAAWF